MSRKIIGSPLDRDNRNNHNDNYTELFRNKNSLQSQVNELVLESGGDSNLEVVQARGGESTLNDRLDKTTQQLADKTEQDDFINFKDTTGSALGILDAKIENRPVIEPEEIVNLWDKDVVTFGLISGVSGNVIESNESNKTTGFLNVHSNTNYTLSHPESVHTLSFRVVFFDEDKQLISGVTDSLKTDKYMSLTVKSPSNTKYMRVSMNLYGVDKLIINVGEKPVEEEGEIWDGGFWENVPVPPLNQDSVTSFHIKDSNVTMVKLSDEVITFIQSNVGEGGSGLDSRGFGSQKTYSDSDAYTTNQEKVIADVSKESQIDLIEFSSNGLLSEIEINYREEDGTLFNYDTTSNDGTESVATTFGALQDNGSAIFEFVEFDDVADTYKIYAKNLKFGNGFKIVVRNNDTVTKNVSVKVVSRQYDTVN